MRKLGGIEEQIRSLSGTEMVEFRKLYAEFDADAKSGKLDAVTEAARRAHAEGRSTKF